jgi:hypothetical protein
MLGPLKYRDLQRSAVVSLETLVPADHVSRHLEAHLDLSVARELVRDRSAAHGRGDHDHDVVDGGTARVILAALVTPAEVMENTPMLDLLWRVRFPWKLWPKRAIGDTTYGIAENIRTLEDAGHPRLCAPARPGPAHPLLPRLALHLRRRAR